MNLTDPRFQDRGKAREYLDAQRWPDGSVRPHCGDAFEAPAPKKAVLSLIGRGGCVASSYVANITAKSVRPLIVTNASRASRLMTDDGKIHPRIGDEFENRHAVDYSASDYARLGGCVHTTTAEHFLSIFKRGLAGVYRSLSEAHLHRRVAQLDFGCNNRSGLGVEDAARVAKIVKGAKGKRLAYRAAGQTANAQAESLRISALAQKWNHANET